MQRKKGTRPAFHRAEKALGPLLGLYIATALLTVASAVVERAAQAVVTGIILSLVAGALSIVACALYWRVLRQAKQCL